MERPQEESEALMYQEEVDVIRLSSMIAGQGVEKTTLSGMRRDGGILAAFADDDDIQEITVVSTNIGFVRRYQKRYKVKT